MIKKIILSATALATLASSTSAFALIDAELRYGTRWYSQEVNDNDVGRAMDGVTLAGHLGIIPFIGLGLSASQFNTKDRDLGTQKTSTLTEVGLDILINPPIPLVYGRVNLPIMSTLEVDGTSAGVDYSSVNQSASVGDVILSVGVAYSIIPLLDLTLEGSHAVVMTKVTEYKSAGVKSENLPGAKPATLQSVMVGVKVGL